MAQGLTLQPRQQAGKRGGKVSHGGRIGQRYFQAALAGGRIGHDAQREAVTVAGWLC